MEDDHVDRPGVEVRQRMKLTGTNSSIGLIVPIASAHLRLNAKHSCGMSVQKRVQINKIQLLKLSMQKHEQQASVWAADVPFERQARRKGISAQKEQLVSPCVPHGLTSCALPTWWLWRGGCTRSLSEHGRETPLRPWYFVLRRGRVGRCQVC